MDPRSDQDRFLALLEGHQGLLYKVAGAYCRHAEDRRELIQDIILQLWRSFARYDGRRRFSTWMYRVALNVAISYCRSQGRRVRPAVSIEGCGLDLAAADQAWEQVSDDVHRLREWIGQLDELNRALILLFLDGASYEDIAEVVGISVSNVGTRLSRIKQKLHRDFNAGQPSGFLESRR